MQPLMALNSHQECRRIESFRLEKSLRCHEPDRLSDGSLEDQKSDKIIQAKTVIMRFRGEQGFIGNRLGSVHTNLAVFYSSPED